MQLITLDQFLDNQDFYISEAQAGKIFVYPTDTIYGIGGIYTEENKDKIFQIKQRDRLDHKKNEGNKVFLDARAIPTIGENVSTNEVKGLHISKTVVCTKKMFSIIAPSFERIEKNYNIADSDSPITNTQIHQYTNSSITINKLKEYLNTYHGVTYIFSYETPGVRIIKHPFQNFVQRLNEPFITTSCNIAGEPPLQDLKNISSDLKSQVDYIIDGGILGGRPSVLIDLIANKIIER